MKKVYDTPVLQAIVFSDVITTSSDDIYAGGDSD